MKSTVEQFVVFATAAIVFASTACAWAEPQYADLVVMDARIVTLAEGPTEAEALAAAGGCIVAVGDEAEVMKWIGPETQVLRAGGKLVTPGLIDAHAHLMGLGESRMRLNLVGTTSEEEVAQRVRQRAGTLPPGAWVLGRGWDQNDWPAKQFPTEQSLTEVSPDRPVCLTRIDGHAVWVNREAMRRAGVDRNTPDPPGGRIVRDAGGEPTGVFVDAAEGLVMAKIPRPSEAEKVEALRLALQECLEMGVTGFHDAGSGREDVARLKKMMAEDRLPVRLYVMLRGSDRRLLDEACARGPEVGLGDHYLTIRAVKLFADGALGSRGALMLDPYDDEADIRGLTVTSQDEIEAVARRALAAGFQVCTHAIGDGANRAVLNAYAAAMAGAASSAGASDTRFRVEHAQILDEADIPRFAQLGVVASMQPTHCTSDMPWVDARVGAERSVEGAYVWRKLLSAGAVIASGSDAPVESVNPLWGIYAAITRQDHQGNPPGGWHPDQRMTMDEALRSFTLGAAYAAFEEDMKGSLEVGKLADLVVWSDDFLAAGSPPAVLLTAKADVTVVGGRIRYERVDKTLATSLKPLALLACAEAFGEDVLDAAVQFVDFGQYGLMANVEVVQGFQLSGNVH